MEYITVRAFARAIGVADTSVREAIEKGRLVESIRLNDKGWVEVNLEIGRREWTENRDPSATLAMGLNEDSGDQSDLTPEESRIVEKNFSFASQRAEREKWAAKMAQLSYEERAGTLVEAAKVRKEAFDFGRKIRDAMMNLPDRVAVELAAEQDANKIHARLMEEIRIALRVVADA